MKRKHEIVKYRDELREKYERAKKRNNLTAKKNLKNKIDTLEWVLFND